MGEPLNNRERVFDAVRLLNDPERLGIGARHITVSTSGVVPGIEAMIGDLPQVNLAISLHAADDRLRDELVPDQPQVAACASVIAAGRRFSEETGRRVSLEYVMIDGVNDSLADAERLAALARGWRSHVNLIPLNPTPGSRWSGTPMRPCQRLRRRAARGRHYRHHSRHPRSRDRGRLRPAARAARQAAPAGSRPRSSQASGRRRSRSDDRQDAPTSADQRQRAECRLQPARGRGATRGGWRRGLDPPGRDGRPLRRQHQHGPGGGGGGPPARRRCPTTAT